MFVRFRKQPLLYCSNFLFELFLVLIIVLSNLVSCQDNKPPTFSATQYIFEVSEDARVGDILNVTNPPLSEIFAMDSEGDNVTYGKVDPSNSPQFSLNLTTGSLSIAQTLDRENTSFYYFEIFANDSQRNGEFLPTVSVQIVILDVNDNPPIFLNNYSFSLDEGVSSGHQVNPSDNPISVSDDDIGNNQPSTFSIVSGGDGRFTIDQSGNILTTLDDSDGVNRTIDFETKPFYNLTVRATNTEPRGSVVVFSETFVTITILNINDENPEFTPASAEKTISINEMDTGSIFTIQAFDRDGTLPVPTTFAYSIIYGNLQLNGADSFTINPTSGDVSVAASGLDHETLAEYTLIIQAQENQTPQTSILTSLTIFVTDINEHAPAFTSSSYQANISEASSIGRAILQVETTDSDLTPSVSYSLDLTVDSTAFDIDSISGLISLNASVDRETKNNYTFQVLAINSDSTGSHTASATVSIFLFDVNDNSPTFGMSEISISIGEQNASIPRVIYDVVLNNGATDMDEGVNKQVKYSLQTGVSVFSIDADAGFVSVLAILDFDVQSQYILTIIATDQSILASDRRTGSFILKINITDVNDNPPVLLLINSHTVEENLPVNSTIFTVTATDSDIGLNAPLSLSILESVPFSISSTSSANFISGEIQTTRSLDFEDNNDKSFRFTIVVSDGSRIDSGIVSITTEDINDNIPIFTEQAGYSFNVAEIQTGLIGAVNANDDDSADFGMVNYMIIGDNDNNFLIDSATGEISIVKALEGDPHESYMFSVVASDSGIPPLATITVVTAQVEDINDNPPILRLDNPQVSIFENMSYESIFIFIADDLDRTSPNNLVEYFIIGSFPVLSQLSSLFVINQTTGELRTGTSPINREDFVEISLSIAAMDQGSPMLSDTTTIHIIINDKNDNRPIFESPSYFVNVDEDFLLGEIILQVRATESSPDANTQISYSLMNMNAALSSDPLQYVSIDSGTGAISLSRSLDFETLVELRLLIIASDGLNTDVSNLTISVNNVNDNNPTLSISTCTQILPENSAVGNFCTLNVADADIDGTSNFAIAGFSLSPTLPQFQILYNAGASVVNLILTQTLDFETTKSFLIEISVTDSGLPSSRTTSLSLQLDVTGINEFSPSFARSNYVFSVVESERIGFVVGVVTATDLDDPSTDDGKFSYNILPPSIPFQINDSTGLISLQSQVDYEVDDMFVFVVNAVDKATLTGTTIVTIHVIDINEYTPVFTNTPFSTSILENVAESHAVIQINATDSDRDDVITFSILDGNNDGAFRIDSNTGEMFTTSISLDFEITQRYIIIVQAADNGTDVRQSSIPVTIVILDVNDNAPVFDRPPVDSFVNEEGANLFVMLVSATDLDSTTNAEIGYSVDLSSTFEINDDGILTTKIALDRENIASYLTTICASDKGNPILSICKSVTISILDINDNVPCFDTSLASVNVLENANGGQVIVSLTVKDLDLSPIFFFTLFNDGGPFSISSSGSAATVILSGTSLITPLDREKRNMYSLNIMVSDQLHSATHLLQVNVTDFNDEIPTFQNDTYILLAPVLENASNGTSVVNVNAIDLDISPNNLIIYSLLVSAEGLFRIESDTGLISVNTELDFETAKSHTLIVQSSDGNLIDKAFVFIPIGDINDNDPVFLENSYSIQVLETVSIGTTILAVQAADADSGDNGNIIYTIVTSNIEIMNTFDLNTTTGILKTSTTLDADSQSNLFTFQISASDTSASPRTVLVDVMIAVLAENEDIPVFNETLYMSFLDENLNPVISILTLFASESDSNAMIQYDIVDSGAKAYFDVNRSSGVLFLINPLDRELFADFTFTVVASDNDFPPRQGFSSVRISITDLNDNNPTFLLREYSVSISESTSINSVIITVRATDNDATATFNKIQYGIVGQVPFSIDINTGIVTVSDDLNFDQDPNIFRLSLSATDPGSNSDTAVLIINLLDENDIVPKVQNIDLSRTISESALGGTEVITLTVEDLDTVGIITYEINSGNTDNSFVIDSSGRITVSVNGLDFETVSSFNLGILISDGIHSITPSVSITITDSNDNAPMFNQESYSISINETNLANTNILDFSVADPDVGDDGSISLYIEASTNIGNIFKLGNPGPIINNISGMILSALSLDRETPGLSLNSSDGSALWTLKIIAFDNSADITKRLTSTADIFITLKDINDNAPKFSSPSYSAQVSESSNIGTLVLTLSASDMDFGLNSFITFYLVSSSSNSGNFTLDSASGELRTALILSRETSSVFVFDVEASDGLLKDVAVVTVTITDINDHNPVFSNPMLTAIISENSPIGTSVSVLAASDEDDGDNGRIIISIIGGDTNSQFRINNGIPGMALLEVAKENIDREIQSSFELILAAQDHGTPNRQGTSIVKITIRDVNDNPPIFSPMQYFGTISEASTDRMVTLNTPIVINDADLGTNSQFMISLDNASIFNINNIARTISLQSSITLDRETEDSFEIQLIALDLGTPTPMSSTATLSISVEDINDNSPIFSSPTYMSSVNEAVPVSTSITTVDALDADIGANGDISYSIISGSEGKFRIDRESGLVETSDRLDRETVNIFNLIVAAFDNGSPFLTGTTAVIVMVTDFNDNSPVFIPSHYTASVEEDKRGIRVVQLNATDTDLGENAVLKYAFLDPIAGSSLPFSIDADTGEISVTGQLDRESIDIYSFEVVVRDNAVVILNRLSSTATVIITIIDVNDVAPSFPGVNAFMTSIQESTRITTIILSPVATDPDLGVGGNIFYSISPESSIFSVGNTTGQIMLIQSLDFDSTGSNGLSEYRFNLVVTDNGIPSLNSSIPVIITVLDENDNVPVFDLSFYSVAVLENITIGTTFIILNAQDNDTNGMINYQIVGGNLNGLFEIDLNTGGISNALSLANLPAVIFELTIRAFESLDTSKFSLTSLHIEITDTNDNAPFFCQTASYEFSVLENTQVIVGQICGLDSDSGINGQFEFRIISGDTDSAFGIDQISGASTANIVVLNNVLNRERIDMYTLSLQIFDKGIPQLQSTPIVAIISILDVNDETPTFLNLPNFTNLSEGTFGGSEVFLVLADDADISSNAIYLFDIISGNDNDVFRIEPETGRIITIKALNFNLISRFILNINVTDQGIPPRSSTSALEILIQDINDHAPLFMPPYEKSIPEDLPSMSFIILVMAVDDDATTNAALIYNLSMVNNGSYFNINNTGHIFLNTTSLDRETQSLYNLVVTACDRGLPVLCSSVDVIVIITDTNDHAPIFTQPEYSFTVLENNPAFSIIGTVFATDLDDGTNGMISYSISSGVSPFNISEVTGEISASVLDREDLNFYQFTVLAVDNGAISNSNTARINITVLDVNDNLPMINTSVFSSQVKENTRIGRIIFDVDAIDIDLGTNSEINYFILGGNQGDFDIHPDSGQVFVNKTLDAERTISYGITIQASDNGIPPLSDIQTLIIDIIDINEHPPIFSVETYTVFIPENSIPPLFLLNVTASDSDLVGSENSEISYFLPPQFQTNYNVNSLTGMVTTDIIFDREVSSFDTFIIMANNPNSSPMLEGSATVRVIVTDANDKIPYFSLNIYSSEISELSQVGNLVLVLIANDDDDPNLLNSKVVFSSSPTNSPEFDASFRINLNGSVIVNGPLDRETLEVYSALVVASDQGIPELSNTSQLFVTLTDENDIPPTFDKPVYLAFYKEDMDPSSQNGLSRLLLNLGFTDGDKDIQNKQSIFSFSSNSPFHFPEFNVTNDGSLFLNIGLDREIRDNYTLYLEVINQLPGHPNGSYCDQSSNSARARFINNQCWLFHSSIVYLSVVDINDNFPVFSSSPFYFTASYDSLFNSEVGTVSAKDADLSIFSDLIYSISGTSDFLVDEITGMIRTNTIFTGRVGEVLQFAVSASDQATNNSLTSNENVIVSVISEFYVLHIFISDSIESTRLCIDDLLQKLRTITSFQVHISTIQESILGSTILLNETVVTFYSFRISDSILSLVPHFELLRQIDDNFRELQAICGGNIDRISSVISNQIQVFEPNNIQFFLILAVCAFFFLCGCIANILSIYQRVLGKRSLSNSDEYVYSGMEGLDILTAQNDIEVNQAFENIPSREEITFESQELKMDLFLDDIPDNAFLTGLDSSTSTGSEITNSNTMMLENEVLNYSSIDDDDVDLSISSI